LSGYEPLNVSAIRDVLQGVGDGRVARAFFWLYFGIPALLIGPSTLLMGAAFPLLQRAVQDDLSQLGTRIGTLLTANIAGSAAGALATGWFLFDRVGTAGTLRLLIVITAALPLLSRGISRTIGSGWSLRSGVISLAAGVALAVALPGNHVVWGRLHGSETGLIVGEDGSGTSVLRRITQPGRDGAIVYVNGLGQSWIPYGGVHTTLGALPAFVHPDPRDAAVIGLGSGDTVFGVAGRPTVERIAAIEIVRPQLGTLRDLAAAWPYPGLTALLADRRIEHVYGDGRLYLAQTERRFDVIEADALRPTSAYAGHLYSDGYFKLLRSRLKPGGIAVSWGPTQRVRDTFATVFPNVVRFGDILMGSNEPIALDLPAIAERLRDDRVQTYFRNAGIDPVRLLMTVLNTEPSILGPRDDRSGLTDINTDLMPKDEFGKPQR
jgi:predicted membrane-bound spermidine synthase